MTVVRLVALLAGAVLLGAGLMLAFLPHRDQIELELGGGADPPRTTAPVSCGPPAFDVLESTEGVEGGWFAYAPTAGVVLSDNSWCVHRARNRVSWGAASALAGVVTLALVRRNLP